MSDVVGTGWAFPPRLDGRGGIAVVSGCDDIERAIRIILETPVGQRVMRPTFGSRLHELVFAPLNADTFGRVELYVTEALAFWEPRIEILEVSAEADQQDTDLAKLLIVVRYRIKSTHDERSLVFPFYRMPPERSR